MWMNGLGLGCSSLALEAEKSQTVPLRMLQTFLSQATSSNELLPVVAFTVFSAGYTASVMVMYWREQQLGLVVSVFCIIIALVETYWNHLRLTIPERLFILLPALLSTGMTGLALCRVAIEEEGWDNRREE